MNACAQTWLAANRQKFTTQHLAIIHNRMEKMDDDRLMVISAVPLKNPYLMLLVTVLAGIVGVHRFLLDEIGMGIFELLTFGLCGILWIIDLFIIVKKTKEYNYTYLLPYL